MLEPLHVVGERDEILPCCLLHLCELRMPGPATRAAAHEEKQEDAAADEHDRRPPAEASRAAAVVARAVAGVGDPVDEVDERRRDAVAAVCVEGPRSRLPASPLRRRY